MASLKTNGKVLTTAELASRWGLTPATLRTWRWSGKGPAHITVDHFGEHGPNKGGSKREVRYRLADVLKYERGMRG